MPNTLDHISFIMDGNNRWRKLNDLTAFEGYKKGADKLIKISNHIFKKYNVAHVSAFALSTNNLQRSKSHISTLLKVLNHFLDDTKNHDLYFNINFYGNMNFLNKNIISKINQFTNSNKKTKHNLNIFINYGGQEDLINALSKIVKNKEKCNKKNIIKNLYTKNLPDPNLIIRTGGFQRLSNFLLYQSAFSEIFFLKKLWPDISTIDINKVISSYYMIDRKFGI